MIERHVFGYKREDDSIPVMQVDSLLDLLGIIESLVGGVHGQGYEAG